MPNGYPKDVAQEVVYVANFGEHIEEATAKMDLPKDTFKEAKDEADKFTKLNTELVAAEKEATRLRKEMNKQQPITEKALRKAGKQIRNTVNVPEEVLTLLDMTGTTDDPLARVAAQMPVLKAKVVLGVVELSYVKHGHQAVDVYSCRTGETEFTYLGRFSLNHFQDARPNRVAGQPEQRDYYAVYMDKDQPVGEQSATVSAVVGSRPGH